MIEKLNLYIKNRINALKSQIKTEEGRIRKNLDNQSNLEYLKYLKGALNEIEKLKNHKL